MVEAVSGHQVLYPFVSDLDDALTQLFVGNAACLEAGLGIRIRWTACVVEPVMR
jgi:hypothetical protein